MEVHAIETKDKKWMLALHVPSLDAKPTIYFSLFAGLPLCGFAVDPSQGL